MSSPHGWPSDSCRSFSRTAAGIQAAAAGIRDAVAVAAGIQAGQAGIRGTRHCCDATACRYQHQTLQSAASDQVGTGPAAAAQGTGTAASGSAGTAGIAPALVAEIRKVFAPCCASDCPADSRMHSVEGLRPALHAASSDNQPLATSAAFGHGRHWPGDLACSMTHPYPGYEATGDVGPRSLGQAAGGRCRPASDSKDSEDCSFGR
mmetsp:Transcript_19167/g.30618  ORF Transcript_19167/g.30618 Transcript_19167/m.30618 type:complete len:206 (+) Transcript_19167:23-640(+)